MIYDVIPSWASLEESSLFLIENAEKEYNAMMASIGIQEYTEAVQGKVVSEADEGFGAKVKGLANKLIDWLKARWNQIKGLFDKAAKAINNQIDKFHQKIGDRRLDKLPAKVANLKDKTFGKTYAYPEFAKISGDGGTPFRAVEVYANNVTSTLKSNGEPEAVGNKLKEVDESFRKTFGAGSADKDSSIKGSIQSWIRGEEVTINKDYLSKHITEMIKNTASFSKVQRDLKASMNSSKKTFDNTIKEIKEGAKDNESFAKLFGVVSPYIKKVHHYSATVSGVILSEMRAKMMKEMSILIRLSTISGVIDTKHESYYGDYSESQTYQSEMASLFNFDI